MLYLKLKNIKNQITFNKIEKRKIINKYIFINLVNRSEMKNYLQNVFNNFLKINKKINKKRVKHNRRCIFNNRNRSISRTFGISRSLLRHFMQSGIIPGYIKSV
jgi:ribosomal protein S14